MNTQKLTREEFEIYAFCQDIGMGVPEWITKKVKAGKLGSSHTEYYRPVNYTAEQLADFRERAGLYYRAQQNRGISSIKSWIVFWGILTIISIIIFIFSRLFSL